VKELGNVYKEHGEQFINDLLTDYVVVTEKLAGSSFSFQKNDNELTFYKGDARKPINLIDRTLMVYYEKPIAYISDLPPAILSQVPNDWRFCFQYFVHNQPSSIHYEKLPHNSLVLTHILVKDERGKTAKIIEDPRVIKDWAAKFHVTPMQPIFQGRLSNTQKEKIKDFISVPVEDQMELFGTDSFTAYLLKGVLNPAIHHTLLHTDLSQPIDSIVFKFYKDGGESTFTAKMIDPYTRSLMKQKEPVDLRRAPADLNEIVLLDILAFLEERGLKRHDVLSNTTEERYLELVSALFNDYVEKRGEDLQKLDFHKADFAKGPEFNLNMDLLRNEKTKKILSQSDVLKDLFKVMLGSLRKKRNTEKEGPIMTSSAIEEFNKMVNKIQNIVQEETDGEFKTFEDYLELKKMNEELYVGNDLEEMIKEEVYLNFKEFTNLSKVNLNEALKVPHKGQGKKKVNIFVGRFQPFTLGHAKVFKQLHKLNGLPVHVLLVRGGKPDPKKRPFDEDAQQRMFQAMQSEYPFLSGSTVIPNGAIDTIYAALRPTYEPALWGYGTDRKKSYGAMIEKPEYRAQLGVLPEFKGHEIQRGDEDISASKVRRALEVDDRKTFERMVPRSLHDFYEELQNILVPIAENAEPIHEEMIDVILGQELIGQIDDKDDEAMRRLRGIVTTGSFKKELYEFLVGTVNFPPEQADRVIRLISRAEDPAKAAGYLLNRTFTLASTVGKKLNGIKAATKFMGTKKISPELWSFNWPTSPAQGPGEVFLSLIFADGRRPASGEKGDLFVGNTEVEVKGPNGRLAGQKGYGDAKQMPVKLWEVGEKVLANPKEFPVGPFSSASMSEVVAKPKPGDLSWNITKKESRKFGEMLQILARSQKPEGKFTNKQKQTISRYIMEAYKNYLLGLDVNSNSAKLVPAINNDGSLNLPLWHSVMVNIYFDYYLSLENFGYIAFNNDAGDFLIVEPSKFGKLMGNGTIWIKTPPSFSSSAGNQGGTYGIDLK
tara:strand:- start:651 stop:3638 length:2988 start_codon:yes stop_codon:yes gene_type:complete